MIELQSEQPEASCCPDHALLVEVALHDGPPADPRLRETLRHTLSCSKCFAKKVMLQAAKAELLGNESSGARRLVAAVSNQPAVADPLATEGPTEAFGTRPVALDIERQRRSSRRTALLGVTSALAMAAGVVLLFRSPEQTTSAQEQPMVSERSGGLTARLHCGAFPEVELSSVGARCPVGEQLIISADSQPQNALPFLTVVSCMESDPCRIVSQGRFQGTTRLVQAGPTMGSDEPVTVRVIWSDREVDDDFLQKTADKREGEATALSLPGSWAQVSFAMRGSND